MLPAFPTAWKVWDPQNITKELYNKISDWLPTVQKELDQNLGVLLTSYEAQTVARALLADAIVGPCKLCYFIDQCQNNNRGTSPKESAQLELVINQLYRFWQEVMRSQLVG